MAAVIPDIDLLVPGLEHRGPTHSLIISTLIFIPFFIQYGKRTTPYFIAFTQHSIIGDYVTGGGIQLLWPLNSIPFGFPTEATSLINILLEWIFFLICFTVLLKTKDAWMLIQSHPSNLTLSVPVSTLILPTFLSFPLHVPILLVIPHLTYLTMFTISILTDFKAILEK